jgi:N6-L-threonylcarbamoyladenine synthase
MMAKREHQRNLVPVLNRALKEAKLLKITNPKSQTTNKSKIQNSKLKIIEKILEKESTLLPSVIEFLTTHQKPDIDAIAVTHGPGLEPCLYVGVNFAKALSYYWDIPVIPINHIEAHILVNFINPSSTFKVKNSKTIFPAISLVVSGGHTQLILVKKIGSYQILGETRDDAAGECFDKAARILGLGYPGGPIIAQLAKQPASSHVKSDIILPRPMMHSKDYDFSFSGLKTAVLYKLQDTSLNTATSKAFIEQMCSAVQDAICDVLIKKTLQAAKDHHAKTIILGGGVSANQQLRLQFDIESSKLKIPVIFPEPKLSTDNGLMIAVAGYFNRTKKIAWQKLSVNANLRIGG